MFKAEELFQNVTDKNHPDETVLTIIQGKGTLPREQAGRNIHYDDASLSNYKKVEQGDFIIHLRSFEGGLEMANEAGIVSPAYTILRCKRPHSSLFYDAYFHTDEFINHNLSKSVEGIRDGRQISYEAFKWLGIPYCEPTEQEKISNLFAALNERIAKQRDLVESLKKYKRGLVKALISGTVAFAGSENKRWETVRLAEIFTISAGGDIDRQNSSPTYSTSYPYPVYANALTNNGLYGYANYFKVEGDSITVSGRGEVGHAIARHCKYVPIVRLLSLVPKYEDDVDFFAYMINATSIYIESTGVPQLTSPQLGAVKVFRPPHFGAEEDFFIAAENRCKDRERRTPNILSGKNPVIHAATALYIKSCCCKPALALQHLSRTACCDAMYLSMLFITPTNCSCLI